MTLTIRFFATVTFMCITFTSISYAMQAEYGVIIGLISVLASFAMLTGAVEDSCQRLEAMRRHPAGGRGNL